MRHWNSDNIVVRLNLLNMHHDRNQRVDVYAHAQEGLATLEPNPEKRLKYADFIETYAALTQAERDRYHREFLPRSAHRENIMGMMQQIREEGRREGRREERREGLLRGIALALKIKFGEPGAAVLPEIQRIEDIALLDRICDSLETVENIEGLRRVYASLE